MAIWTPKKHQTGHTIRMVIPSSYRVICRFAKLSGLNQLHIKRKLSRRGAYLVNREDVPRGQRFVLPHGTLIIESLLDHLQCLAV